MLTTFRLLGVKGVGSRLVVVSITAFIAGSAQAALLVLISQAGVDSAEASSRFKLGTFLLSSRDVIGLCLILLIVFTISSLASALFASSMAAVALRESRQAMIEAFFKANWDTQSTERLGHIQQLLTMQCVYVANVAAGLTTGAQSLLSFLALISAAFLVSPVTACGVIMVGFVIFLVFRPINSLSRKTSERVAYDTNDMATLVTEYTRLTREFRVFGVEERAVGHLRESSAVAATSFLKGRQLAAVVPFIYQSLALLVVVLSLGLFLGHHGKGLAGVAAVLLLMIRSMSYGTSLQSIVQQLSEYEGVLSGLRGEFERLCRNAEPRSVGRRPVGYSIECNGVTFGYNDRTQALRAVSFIVPEGNILGVVGRSGSGKTTLSQLLLGLREPDSGYVRLGGVDVASLERDRASDLALVTQEPVLLQSSVAENIALFREVDSEEIVAAARLAHFHDDVESMPDRYKTMVGEGGSSMSGGQRQRLAIARALLAKPKLLILDEPTSALDGRSEALLAGTLAGLRGWMTVVIISHRLVTVDVCDLLLVLDHGTIADFGPTKMIKNGVAFRQVFESDPSSVLPNE